MTLAYSDAATNRSKLDSTRRASAPPVLIAAAQTTKAATGGRRSSAPGAVQTSAAGLLTGEVNSSVRRASLPAAGSLPGPVRRSSVLGTASAGKHDPLTQAGQSQKAGRRASVPAVGPLGLLPAAGEATARLVANITVPRSHEAVELHKEARRLSINQRDTSAITCKTKIISAASKYPRQYVILLKAVFDEYDGDKSGSVNQAELYDALQKRKKAGKSKHERQAEFETLDNHYSEFHASMQEALKKDDDGELTFMELLGDIFPQATQLELQTMKKWANIAEKEKVVDPLTPEERQEICSLFAMYDLDKSKDLTLSEMQKAYGSFMSKGEVEELFREADTDHNGTIDLEEFTDMIVATGMISINERDLYR